MKKLAIVLFVLTASCGDDEPNTWGDVVEEFSGHYCRALARCGHVDDIPVCREHVSWHMCVPDHTCDEEVDPGDAVAALHACAEALWKYDDSGEYDLACYRMASWGVLPKECQPLLDLWPKE